MPERTTITQVTQIGLETTPGTAVPANKRLRSVSIELSPDGNIDTFRASGSKYPALASLGKEWAGGDIEGRATYTELLYLFAGLLGDPTTSTPGGATLARQHQWLIQPTALQDGRAFTVEKGSSVRAHRAPYSVINELGLEFSRESIEVSGSLMARRVEDGVSLTAGPTLLALEPILPSQVSVYLDPLWANLGTTKLIRVLGASFNIGDRFGALWPLDSAQPSYAATFEIEPSSEIGLTMEADAAGMGILPTMRNGTEAALRIEAKGAEIDVGVALSAYRLTLDLPVKVTELPDMSDQDGVYGVEWTYSLFDSALAASAGRIQLVNAITAL